MNDVGFIDPNSEWSVTVGEDGSVEVNRLDLKEENAKLRELVKDMWRDGMCECDERGACAECEYGYLDRLRKLGIEVAE